MQPKIPSSGAHAVRLRSTRTLPFRVLLVGLAVGLAGGRASAQKSERTLGQFQHTSWTAKAGAPNGVTEVAQTTDGYLWLGSPGGLYRFDGIRFERYVPPNGQSIRAESIDCMKATPDGGLWIGFAHSGASFLKQGRITNYGVPDKGDAPGKVFEFAVDHDGGIWAGSLQGLAKFDGSQWRYVSEEFGYTGKTATAILVDRDGTLWVSSYEALFYLPRNEKHFRKAADLPTGGANIIRQSPDGTIYVANSRNAKPVRGVPSRLIRPLLFQGGEGDRAQPSLFAIDSVNRSVVDSSGSLWITTTEGLFRVAHPERLRQKTVAPFEDREFERFRAKDGLSSDYTFSVFEDRDGNIWVGTDHGLERFSEARVVPIAEAQGPPQLVAGDHGDVWGVAPDFPKAHLLHLSGTSFTSSVISANPLIAARGSNGVLWLGGYGALWRFQNGKSVPVPLPQGVNPHMPMQALAEDASGDLWVSIARSGVFRLHEGSWAVNGDIPDLVKSTAWSLMPESNGRMWFGYATNKLAFAEGTHVRNFSETDGLKVGNVQAIQPEGDHVWIAGDRGLALYRNGQLQPLVADTEGVLAGISGVAETRDGDLWLNTSQGIVRVPQLELQRAIARQGYGMRCEVFDSLDGLTGTAPQVRPLPTLVKSSDGRLWFSIFNSVAQIDPGHLRRNTTLPSVFIRSIDSAGKVSDDPSDEIIPLPSSSVHIEYTAPNLSIPERVRFQYKLEGFDRDWQNAGGRREAFYTNLSPGTYHFHVIACNHDGLWNETGTTVSFSIAPTYYQTRVFQFVCIAAGAGLLWLLYLWRLQRATTQIQQRLGAQLEERERIARELHDTLLQGFQGLVLRLQAVMKTLPADAPAHQMIEKVLDRADDVLLEGRQSVRDLRQAGEAGNELSEALKSHGDELAQGSSAAFSLLVTGMPRALGPVVFTETCRIAREALTNAFQHSGATKIGAELIYSDVGVCLTVRDDGMGIDSTILQKGRRGHWGLSGMRERAQKIGGKFSVGNNSGGGAVVELTIPASVAYPQKSPETLWQRFRRLTRHGASS